VSILLELDHRERMRLRMRVEYIGYQKFGADTVIKFEEN